MQKGQWSEAKGAGDLAPSICQSICAHTCQEGTFMSTVLQKNLHQIWRGVVFTGHIGSKKIVIWKATEAVR